MKLISTTDYIARHFGFYGAIDVLADAGYDGIDFSAFTEEFYTDAHPKDFYIEARKRAEDRGLSFEQAHSPFHFPAFGGVENTEARTEAVIGSMRNASLLGVKTIVVHPLHYMWYRDGDNAEKLVEMTVAHYRRLLPYAEEWGIRIATENMYHRHRTMITDSVCSRPEEMIRVFEEVGSPHLTCCLDIGHTALVRSDTVKFIRALGKERLGCLHVHDVEADVDAHTLPYYGQIEWERVMEALASIGYEGNLTYEADNFLSPLPQELYPDAARFMASVGRHLISVFHGAK